MNFEKHVNRKKTINGHLTREKMMGRKHDIEVVMMRWKREKKI